MNDMNEIQCFVRAVELKSITAASRALAVPKSTVSRKIQSLEKRLGLTLLVRTTRALNLTSAGKAYFEKAAIAFRELEQAEELVDRSRDSVEGVLRITAPIEFAIGPFHRMLGDFLAAHPKVRIEVSLTERVVDLIGEGFDLGFRAGELADSTLKARRLAPFEGRVVASPDYLKRRGAPKSPSDFDEHELINFAPGGKPYKWPLSGPDGRRELTTRGRLTLNHMLAVKEAAVGGLGLALLPNFMSATEVAQKRLKVVCPEWSSPSLRIQIVYPAQKFVSRKLRTFIDFAVQNLEL